MLNLPLRPRLLLLQQASRQPPKAKKKTDPFLGMQAFFCPQQPNIPFLSWGFACESEKKFFKQLLHRLTVISLLFTHPYMGSFFSKKKAENQKPARVISFSLCCSRLFVAFNRHEKTLRI